MTRQPDARRPALSLDELERGVRAGDRAVLGRAITLIESHHPEHAQTAQELLTRLMPHTGNSVRIGITGPPGVGKSTFIERFGMNLVGDGHRVAVLAVDPSSGISGGSILGDKTRMAELGSHVNAFIRPSPSAGTLGGVANKTRESMLVCEAAGFDVVLIETVGVGQSETVVAQTTDFFLVLLLPGAGDELQGIKRGLLEHADLLAVNKADGDNVRRADVAQREFTTAMHFMPPRDAGWTPRVLTCSARENRGLAEIWRTIEEHQTQLEQAGVLETKRSEQLLRWMWKLVDEQVHAALREHPGVKSLLPSLEREVHAGRVPATLAARRVLRAFGIERED